MTRAMDNRMSGWSYNNRYLGDPDHANHRYIFTKSLAAELEPHGTRNPLSPSLTLFIMLLDMDSTYLAMRSAITRTYRDLQVWKPAHALGHDSAAIIPCLGPRGSIPNPRQHMLILIRNVNIAQWNGLFTARQLRKRGRQSHQISIRG